MYDTLTTTKYPRRITSILISNETHTVQTNIPYSVSFLEKPSEDYAVTISGYTEVTSIPTSAAEFYVDFAKSIIYFHSSKAGEIVEVNYYGTGSPIIADDVNRFSSFLNNMKSLFFSFFTEALSGSRVRLYEGKFVYDTVVYTRKELFMDFSSTGNFPVSISAGYFKKVLVGIYLSAQLVAVVEGEEVNRYDGTRLPSYTSDFKPVAIVTVGSGFNILQKDVIPIRNFSL